MSYRSDLDAAHARVDALERELARERAKREQVAAECSRFYAERLEAELAREQQPIVALPIRTARHRSAPEPTGMDLLAATSIGVMSLLVFFTICSEVLR